MNKWCGKVGFSIPNEVSPGIWAHNNITEHRYFGEIINNRWRRQNSGNVNDNVNISNQISIVADPYARNHISSLVWVEFQGKKWKVTDAEVRYPRLILSIGGVWNGQ